jgi:hypothetical protein
MADKLIRKRVPIERIMELPIISKIKRVKFDPKRVTAIFELADEVRKELAGLADEYRVEVSI